MIFLIGVVDEHQKPRCTSGKSSISIHKSASIRRVAGWMQTAPHLEFVISSGDRFGKFVIYPSVFASGPLSWPTEGILGAEIRSQKKRALFTKFRIRVANRMHQHPFLQPLWDARSCPPFLVGDLDVHCLVERLEVSFIETDREKRNFGNDILLRFLHCLSEKKINNVVVLGFSGFKMKLENMDFCRI